MRKVLLDTAIATSDPLVMFAGLDAYRQAGGELRPDLFSDDGDGFITSVDVLNELAAAKLEAIAAKHRAAGWLWVDARPHCEYGDIASFRRIAQGYREPTEK